MHATAGPPTGSIVCARCHRRASFTLDFPAGTAARIDRMPVASDNRISPEIAADSGTWGRCVVLPEMVGTDLELVAERIAVPAAGLRRRFNRFPGIGQKKAAMVAES